MAGLGRRVQEVWDIILDYYIADQGGYADCHSDVHPMLRHWNIRPPSRRIIDLALYRSLLPMLSTCSRLHSLVEGLAYGRLYFDEDHQVLLPGFMRLLASYPSLGFHVKSLSGIPYQWFSTVLQLPNLEMVEITGMVEDGAWNTGHSNGIIGATSLCLRNCYASQLPLTRFIEVFAGLQELRLDLAPQFFTADREDQDPIYMDISSILQSHKSTLRRLTLTLPIEDDQVVPEALEITLELSDFPVLSDLHLSSECLDLMKPKPGHLISDYLPNPLRALEIVDTRWDPFKPLEDACRLIGHILEAKRERENLPYLEKVLVYVWEGAGDWLSEEEDTWNKPRQWFPQEETQAEFDAAEFEIRIFQNCTWLLQE